MVLGHFGALELLGVEGAVEHHLANAIGGVGFGDAFEEDVCLAQAREPRGTLVTVAYMSKKFGALPGRYFVVDVPRD